MSVTIHTITRFTVQILTKRVSEHAHTLATVRLYDDDNISRAVIVFENYGGEEPPKPTGDHAAQSATAFLDAVHYKAYMDTLRMEKTLYLKMGWAQQGKTMALSQVSIDTKKEVIGEYFTLTDSPQKTH